MWPLTELILTRKKELWTSDGSLHTPISCESHRVAHDAAPGEWRCCQYWQRKLSNKLNAKAFAHGNGVGVAKLLWSGADSREIPFSSLPPKYVVKLVNGCASEQVMPVCEGLDLLRGQAAGPSDVKRFFQALHRQKQYRDVEILVEEFIEPAPGEMIPRDYKVYCFGGRAQFIEVINRSARTDAWYTAEWTRVPDRMQRCFAPDPVTQEAPTQLAALLDAAAKLSLAYEYPFVRVDFFVTSEAVIFGEFTHTPFSGKSLGLYTDYANETLGRMWSCALQDWMGKRSSIEVGS